MVIDNKYSVALRAASLGIGETSSGLICPECGGGEHNDKSFAITRTKDNLALYICYRAKCGYKGAVNLNTGNHSASTSIVKTEKQPNPYNKPYVNLDDEKRKNLLEKFPHLPDRYLHGVRYGEEDNRYLFPILSMYNTRIGYVARSLTDKPKTITYWDTRKHTMAHMALKNHTNDVVIVEDIPSAESISSVAKVDSVAILGSHINDELVLTLRKTLGYKKLILALDMDAWEKANKFESKYRLLGLRAKMWQSGLDPKDMSSEELIEVFGG